MACFVAPATVAVVTTVVRKVVEKRETAAAAQNSTEAAMGASKVIDSLQTKWTKRLGWLNAMLWGGTVMLVLDHLLSGELILRPPFLTALGDSALAGEMVREILVVGGAMTAAVFVAWGAMIFVIEARAKAKARLARES